MMGGEIGVVSQPGEGSTFWFTIECGVVDTTQSGSYPLPKDLRGLKVLVVDDNAVSRRVLKLALESFSFAVWEASGGSEALKALKSAHGSGEKPFELVLLDWRMPEMDGITVAQQIHRDPLLKTLPRIVMVTAYGREQMLQRAHEAKLEGFLIKPFSSSELFDAIMGAFGHQTRIHREADPFSLESVEGLDRIRGAHLLLVEDKEVNQEVACGILEGEGFTVSVANNGREALDKVLKYGDNYDLVIMDLQMPEMDGYTAAREIRKNERFERLPILAMTADAMSGVQERVFAAGMNGHASKPIDPPKLFADLVKWIDPERVSSAAGPLPITSRAELPDIPGLDTKRGLARLQGRSDLYLRVLEKFTSRQADAGLQLSEALSSGDFEEARRLLHSLKGVVGSVSAPRLLGAVKDLDRALETEDSPSWQSLLEIFLRELDHILQGLQEHFAVVHEVHDTRGQPTELNRVEITALLGELENLLKDDDTGASGVLKKLQDHLPESVCTEELQRLAQAIEEYDFETGLECLRAFSSELSEPESATL